MNKTTSIIIVLILIAGSFYGGIKYDQNTTATAKQNQTAGMGRGGRGGFGGMGGGITFGQILSKDSQSITMSLTNSSSTPTGQNGSAIVYLSSSTTILKTTVGTPTDLTIGDTITVTGLKQTNGAIEATAIQIRSRQGK